MKTDQTTGHTSRKASRKKALMRACALGLSVVLMFSGMAACAPKSEDGKAGSETTTTATQKYKAGTYTGTGTGNGGTITVDVTFSDDAITNIEVVSNSETPIVAEDALESIPAAVIEYQSLGVDTCAGATASSLGIIAAISDAVEQAGGNVNELKKVPAGTTSTESVEKEADAIVIGGGGAGMSATLRLAELGQKVILVEKTYRLGGSISVSGGNQVVQGSELQAEAGVTDDSAESMIEDFQKNGENECVPELISLYANNIGETTNWLNQTLGVQYDMDGGLHNLAEYSHNRELAYKGGGAEATRTLKADLAASTNAEVMLDTTAKELIVENGKVCGVKATGKDGTSYTIKADNVVLATGGYGNADQYLSESLKNSLYYGLMTSTGDGLDMALASDVDAATIYMDYAKLYPNGVETSPGRAKSTIDGNLLVWKKSAILVSPEGERVVNEHASNHDILEVELEQQDQMLYLLMDQANYDVWSSKLANTGFNEDAVKGYLEANGTSDPIFAHADTIED